MGRCRIGAFERGPSTGAGEDELQPWLPPVSIYSFDQQVSNAALIGAFDADNAEFLAEHLDELQGDVVLDCVRLESLDARAARVLLRFREALRRHGRQLMFRSLPESCRAILMRHARDA